MVTEGIVATNEALYKTKIFVDDPENLIGFRTSLKHYSDIVNNQIIQYFEIGYFMEMLYEGEYEAFKILKMDKIHVDFDLYDFDILRKRETELVSRKLVDNLMEEAKNLYTTLEDPQNLSLKASKNKNEFLVEKLAYNNKNAYICLRNLILVESILKNLIFDIDGLNNSLLQGVRDGKFGLSAIKDGYEMYLKNIDNLELNSNIPLMPDFHIMNDILKDIRNVKIETLNVTRG